MVQPFFPAVTGWWYQGQRIHIQEPVFGWIKYVRPNSKLYISYAVAAAFFGLTGLGLLRLWHADTRRLWPMLMLPAALLGLYAGITVLGRMNLRPSRYVLCSNSYYTYTALLLFLVSAAVAWQGLARLPTRGVSAAFAVTFFGLMFLGAYSSGRIHHVAERVRSTYADFHGAVAAVSDFIEAHRHEPDFRLAFDLRPDDLFPVTHSVPFALALFPEWIDNHDPKYVVTFEEGRAEFLTAAAYRARHAGPGQLFPDLVHISSTYNVHYWRGSYYGTLHWDDVFRPGMKDYAYVVEGRTLAEVLDKVPERYAEFKEDLRTGYCIPPRLGTETIAKDYRGFELTLAGSYYYATCNADGPFHINRFNARCYSAYFVAEDEETLRRRVDNHVAYVAGTLRVP
jgi:hypothetical protein